VHFPKNVLMLEPCIPQQAVQALLCTERAHAAVAARFSLFLQEHAGTPTLTSPSAHAATTQRRPRSCTMEFPFPFARARPARSEAGCIVSGQASHAEADHDKDGERWASLPRCPPRGSGTLKRWRSAR